MATTEVLQSFTEVASTVVIACFLLLFAKLLGNRLAGYDLQKELYQADNAAAGAAAMGVLLGCTAAMAGAFMGPTQAGLGDNLTAAGYALFGVVLVLLSRYVNRHILFHSFIDAEQVKTERNAGVGAVRGASYLATGIVAGGAFAGHGSILTAVVFFALGQVAMLVFARLYEKLSPFDLHDEMAKGNTAAGLAFAGHIVAIAIVVAASAAGDFTNWRTDLSAFALALASGFIFMPLARFVTNLTFVPGSSLAREIVEDKNVNAGLIEAATAISIAIAIAVSL